MTDLSSLDRHKFSEEHSAYIIMVQPLIQRTKDLKAHRSQLLFQDLLSSPSVDETSWLKFAASPSNPSV